MQKDFWIEKWNQKQTGFHQSDVNAFLQKYWAHTGARAGAAVFVPLCGKSRDMIWLQEQGHAVLGVEFSPLAVADFFGENGLEPATAPRGAFVESAAGDIRLLCGDFFDLVREDLEGVRAVYDRAALIALPPDLRKNYAARLKDLLPPGCVLLLVTLEYPQGAISGPPFSVTEEEVSSLFAGARALRLLERQDVLPQNAHLKERGINALDECCYLAGF